MKITLETEDSAHSFTLNDTDEGRLLDYVQMLRLRTAKVVVRLVSAGAQKIRVIKCVRHLTGLDLKAAKGVVDRAPIVVGQFNYDEAFQFITEVNQDCSGGIAKMENIPEPVDTILATRLAHFLAGLGFIDCPGGAEWQKRLDEPDERWTASYFNRAWRGAAKHATVSEAGAIWRREEKNDGEG